MILSIFQGKKRLKMSIFHDENGGKMTFFRLQQTIDELNAYIAEHSLVPITSGYNVTVKEIKSMAEIDKMEIDVYVGISPNIL